MSQRYNIRISKIKKNLIEQRYCAIVKMWYDKILWEKTTKLTLDEILNAMKKQTNWMEDPSVLRFAIDDKENKVICYRSGNGNEEILCVIVCENIYS